jgi:hypothetical protein
VVTGCLLLGAGAKLNRRFFVGSERLIKAAWRRCIVSPNDVPSSTVRLASGFYPALLLIFLKNNFNKNKNRRCLDCLLLSKFIIRFTKIHGLDHAQPA